MTFWDLKRTSFNFYKIYNLTIPTSFRNLPSVHITTLFTVIFDRHTECVYLLECDKILNVNEMHLGNSGDTHRCHNGASVTYMHMYESILGAFWKIFGIGSHPSRAFIGHSGCLHSSRTHGKATRVSSPISELAANAPHHRARSRSHIYFS